MIALVLCSIVVFSQAWGMKYTDCGSKTGKIIDVHMTGCEETDVCELKRGETYTYRVTFDSLTNTENVKTVVHGIIGGVSMPFPLPNPDACDYGNLDCPLENGKSYTYLKEFQVRNNYPLVQADVKYELQDDNED
ncbi:Protein NPC2-like protein, partial [Stegodyphus mimosarum]